MAKNEQGNYVQGSSEQDKSVQGNSEEEHSELASAEYEESEYGNFAYGIPEQGNMEKYKWGNSEQDSSDDEGYEQGCRYMKQLGRKLLNSMTGEI